MPPGVQADRHRELKQSITASLLTRDALTRLLWTRDGSPRAAPLRDVRRDRRIFYTAVRAGIAKPVDLRPRGKTTVRVASTRHVTTRRPHTLVAHAETRGRPHTLVARAGMRGRPHTRWDEGTRFIGTRCENACCDDALWEAEIGLAGRSALNAEFISARMAAMTAPIPIKRLMVYFRDRNNVRTVAMR